MEALANIQQELKAPKGQENKFGGYKYRSCEDILEAVKPLLKKYEATITISDSMQSVGDRVYVCATVKFCAKDGTNEEVTAFAREAASRKGMDDSQITGATSSYARKYALNGLLLIDDTKDADATNKHDDADAKERYAKKELQKFKAAIFPRLEKYHAEALQLAFEESGYISEAEDKGDMIRELLAQANSKEKLSTIGRRAKELQSEIDESLK
ncbi:MAG: ERF family protein [Rickettsiales bacterium]